MLRNRLQNLLPLKFHHALNIFIKLLFAALVHFYSVFVEESMIICSSQHIIHGENLKRSSFFTDETKKLVLACLRLGTGSNIYYFWSFTMHSISSPIFFSRTWCNSTPFYSKRTRYTVHLSDSSFGGYFEKKQRFHRWHQKSGFNLSMLRNRLQHILLLKFHHALNIFIKFLFAALVHFYSVFVEESMIIRSPQQFIHGENLKRSNLFTDETKKVFQHLLLFILSTLRNRFQHLLLLKFHHALNNFIKIFFAALVRFYSVLI